MRKEYTTSAISTGVLWSILREHGNSDADLLEKTGIDPSVLHSPSKRIPLGQHLCLWELAIGVTGDPALGLHLPNYYAPQQFHFVSSIIFSSPTILKGLQQWGRYDSVICDADRIELQESGGYVTFVFSNISPSHRNRWVPELYFSLMNNWFQRATNNECAIEEIWMTHPAPEYADEYQAVFNTKILYDQTEYHVRWKKESLNSRLKTHDPYYHAILKQYADNSISSHEKAGAFSHEIRQSIIERLPSNQADIQTIADAFHMDRRTLLRKLKSEGTTFKDLLEDTRKKLAHDYLAGGLSISQISFMLGFLATSSFQVAFKRWYNQSPGCYRRDHLV